MRANASGSKHIRAVFRHRVRCCATGARRRIPILYPEPRQRPQEPEGGEGGSRERGPAPSMHPPAGPTGECKRRRTTYPLSRFSMHARRTEPNRSMCEKYRGFKFPARPIHRIHCAWGYSWGHLWRPAWGHGHPPFIPHIRTKPQPCVLRLYAVYRRYQEGSWQQCYHCSWCCSGEAGRGHSPGSANDEHQGRWAGCIGK